MILLGMTGCGRDTEIQYFNRESAGDVYVQDEAIYTEPLSETDSAEEQEAPETVSELICVHVCGQVLQPGVVMLPVGSRAWEAVEAAGGLTAEAEEAAVNLAVVLQDGEKLYIPAIGECIIETDAADESGLVNLNTADAARLQSLPGIGESRAADILAYREKNGFFHSVEEIMQVPGIKESIYEKIRDKITVD